MKPLGTALVTGASRGLGRATALALAERGFDVVATMRDPADGEALRAEARSSGARIRIETLDVTKPESIRLPETLTVLVNNAGVEGPYLPVEHADLETWRSVFETNVFGLLEVTQRAIPALRRAGGGVICNVTSCSILVPMPLFAAYRASKAAVSALGESMRTELARSGIRVVEVQPGAIQTDMLAESERMPEAVGCPGYERLAEQVRDARAGAGTGTPADEAAGRIVDAILEDDGPLRRACDPMGEALLGAWRTSDDETMMAGMLRLFAGE